MAFKVRSHRKSNPNVPIVPRTVSRRVTWTRRVDARHHGVEWREHEPCLWCLAQFSHYAESTPRHANSPETNGVSLITILPVYVSKANPLMVLHSPLSIEGMWIHVLGVLYPWWCQTATVTKLSVGTGGGAAYAITKVYPIAFKVISDARIKSTYETVTGTNIGCRLRKIILIPLLPW